MKYPNDKGLRRQNIRKQNKKEIFSASARNYFELKAEQQIMNNFNAAAIFVATKQNIINAIFNNIKLTLRISGRRVRLIVTSDRRQEEGRGGTNKSEE